MLATHNLAHGLQERDDVRVVKLRLEQGWDDEGGRRL
jgi:hypothetical protein